MTPDPSPLPNRRRPGRLQLAALAGASLLLIGGAAVTMAASPAPSTSPAPDAPSDPGTGGWGFERLGRGGAGMFDGFAGFAGRHGGFGAGNISITAIDGSSISLRTVDGWTRTITVTADTEISKNGETAALSDLEVGDRIRFRQAANDDGTYTITALAVVQDAVIGQVTAKDGDSLTLAQPDGSSVTVTVDGSTTYTVAGETGKALADVEVGMIVAATGEQNDDGSLHATAVRAGSIWQGLGRGFRDGRGPGKWLDPAPSASPDTSSSAG